MANNGQGLDSRIKPPGPVAIRWLEREPVVTTDAQHLEAVAAELGKVLPAYAFEVETILRVRAWGRHGEKVIDVALADGASAKEVVQKIVMGLEG